MDMAWQTQTGPIREPQTANRRLITAAALAYVVSTGLGVVMRFELLGLGTGLPFDHLLHAHSHTLYFGWAGLGVLVGAMRLLPGTSKGLRRTAILLALSIPAVFFGFLGLGYHPVTIAISTVVMFTWYLAAWLWWREAKTLSGVEISMLRAAFGYLIASSLGIWVLGILQASETGTALSEALAVHAFLLGFAWFLVLAVVGFITVNSRHLGLRLDNDLVRRALTWWAPVAIFTFPLGVSGGPEVAWLGPAARLAGLALLYPAWIWTRALWQAAPPGGRGWAWRAAAIWFGAAAVSTAVVSIAGTGALSAGGRHGLVLYLHVLLVGFISASLLTLLPARTSYGLVNAHHVTLGVMIGGLALAMAGAVMPGLWLAAVGAVGLWGVGVVWALRGNRSLSSVQPREQS